MQCNRCLIVGGVVLNATPLEKDLPFCYRMRCHVFCSPATPLLCIDQKLMSPQTPGDRKGHGNIGPNAGNNPKDP